jgi:hypothetical protein
MKKSYAFILEACKVNTVTLLILLQNPYAAGLYVGSRALALADIVIDKGRLEIFDIQFCLGAYGDLGKGVS